METVKLSSKEQIVIPKTMRAIAMAYWPDRVREK
jgi:hypothetical protein